MKLQFSILRLLLAMTSLSIAFSLFRHVGILGNDIRTLFAVFAVILTMVFLVPPWALAWHDDDRPQPAESYDDAGE